MGLTRPPTPWVQAGKLFRVLQQCNPPSATPEMMVAVGKEPRRPFGKKCPVPTFHEGAWGQANDLGQDREEVPDTGALGLPVLKDLEDALAHTSDLSFSVSLQSRTGS